MSSDPGGWQHRGLPDRVTWLGHATVLLALGRVRVLTDPLLRGRVAHLRRHAPPVDPPQDLDAILLSHLHRDHADGPSLRRLPDVPAVVPAGAADTVLGLGPKVIVELRAGDTHTIGDVTITAVPADHEGRRSPLHTPVEALGFVLERAGRRIYFAGDTDVFDDMADLRPVDLALLPIWGWGTSLGAGHMDPEVAAHAAALLAPRVVIPIHWATYLPLGNSADHALLREPGPTFARHMREVAPDVEVALLKPGESLDLPDAAAGAPPPAQDPGP